jgi:GNAT superfamily N-acetyltransferase
VNDATAHPHLRAVVPNDLPFLWDMLYEAAVVAPEIRVLEKRAALALPHIARHLNGWGRRGDAGVIAVAPDASPLGAAWYRLYPPEERGYGIVAWPNVPELSIGVAAIHRRRGIGAALLTALQARAAADRYRQLTLSVDPTNNEARRLYTRQGFKEIPTTNPNLGTSLLMVANL